MRDLRERAERSTSARSESLIRQQKKIQKDFRNFLLTARSISGYITVPATTQRLICVPHEKKIQTVLTLVAESD
jgi:hypothetical protein